MYKYTKIETYTLYFNFLQKGEPLQSNKIKKMRFRSHTKVPEKILLLEVYSVSVNSCRHLIRPKSLQFASFSHGCFSMLFVNITHSELCRGLYLVLIVCGRECL